MPMCFFTGLLIINHILRLDKRAGWDAKSKLFITDLGINYLADGSKQKGPQVKVIKH